MRIKIFNDLGGRPAIPDFNIPETYNSMTDEFKQLYGKKGVYFIFPSETAKNPKYIGRSISNLGKTIARHYQKWATANERKYTDDNPKELKKLYVEVVEMPNATDEEIYQREAEEIDKYKPRLNMIKEVSKWKNNVNQYQAANEQLKRDFEEYKTRIATEQEQAAREIAQQEAKEQEERAAQEAAKLEQQAAEEKAAQEEILKKEQQEAAEQEERLKQSEQEYLRRKKEMEKIDNEIKAKYAYKNPF